MQVDRQTLLFFVIMFVFLQLMGGNEQPQSSKDRETLYLFHKQHRLSQSQLESAQYTDGYGNLTGFHLSYQDLLDGKNASQWPIHEYTPDHPWVEKQEFSLLPDPVSARVKEFWAVNSATDNDAYLMNISGNAYGEFIKSRDIPKPKQYKFPLPQYLQDYYESYTQGKYEDEKQRYDNDPENNEPPTPPSDRPDDIDVVGNITAHQGKISADLSNLDYNYKNQRLSRFIRNDTEKVNNAVIANVNINFKSYDESESHQFDTRGVYFQDTGSLISISNSAKFFGDYALDHLIINQKHFKNAKTLMSQLLNITNIDRDISLEDMNSDILKSVDHCEIISYIQFKKTGFSKEKLNEIDEELRNPTGLPLPSQIPKLEIDNFLIYSPDCGIVFEMKPETIFTGLKAEYLSKKLKNVLIGLLSIVAIQLLLYLRQIKLTRTPGELSIISIKTLYFLGYQDALIALMFLLISTLLEGLYLLLASIAVITFIMCGIFELRFMVAVLSTQVNERGSSWWEILRGGTRVNENGEGTGAEPNNTPDSNDAPNNTPDLAPEARAPAARPADELPIITDESSFTNGIFAGGFTLCIISTFLIINSLEWRTKYRIGFEYIGLLLINSYWIPQFLRNTLKNRRKSFTWEFVIITSILRVMPICYFGLVKSNPLRHHFDPKLVITISFWLTLQILLLYLQQYLGPRFWVNEKWLPKAYDYQPILSLKDLESGFVSDIKEGIKLENESNGVIETPCTCPICMTEFPLPIVVKDEARRHVNSKGYMVTPCHHIFHTECLESWMKYKLQCPVCRHSLPPI